MWNRTYDYVLSQIIKDDQIIGNLEAFAKKVSLHFYYTPRLLTDQSFVFDPVLMNAWWAEGRELFQVEKPVSYGIEP